MDLSQLSLKSHFISVCVCQTVRTWRSPPRWTSSRSRCWRLWRSTWGSVGPASPTCSPKPWWRSQTCAASALKVKDVRVRALPHFNFSELTFNAHPGPAHSAEPLTPYEVLSVLRDPQRPPCPLADLDPWLWNDMPEEVIVPLLYPLCICL